MSEDSHDVHLDRQTAFGRSANQYGIEQHSQTRLSRSETHDASDTVSSFPPTSLDRAAQSGSSVSGST